MVDSLRKEQLKLMPGSHINRKTLKKVRTPQTKCHLVNVIKALWKKNHGSVSGLTLPQNRIQKIRKELAKSVRIICQQNGETQLLAAHTCRPSQNSQQKPSLEVTPMTMGIFFPLHFALTPIIFSFELDLDNVKVNQQAEIVRIQTDTHWTDQLLHLDH